MNELVRVADAAINYSAAPLAGRQAYISQIAYASSLLPKTVQRNSYEEQVAATFYIAEFGAMMGIHPLEALSGIHLIEGKPSISAGLMSAMIRKAGHKLRVTESGSWKAKTYVARVVIIRADDPEFEHVAEFGYEHAEQAGLAKKQGPWSNYPNAMCKARAISACARQAAEDALGGARYTPEELGANVNDSGEVIDIGHVEADPVRHEQPQHEQRPQERPQEPSVRPTAQAAAPAAASPADVPDEAILANLAPEVVQHSESAWVAAGEFDLDSLRGVWDSAKALHLLQSPAVAFKAEGGLELWGRKPDGSPMTLNELIGHLGEQVKQRQQAAPAEAPTEAEASQDPEILDAEIVEPDAGNDPETA